MEFSPPRSESDPSDSRSRLRELFAAAPDPIFIVDANGVIAEANEEATRCFGFPLSEIVGRPIDVLFPEAHGNPHEAAHRAFQNVARGSMGNGRNLRARRADGSTFPVDVRLGPFETPSGRQVVAIVHDISELRGAQEELARRAQALTRANHELEAFAYSVSHDLRTPLRALQGLGQALEEDFSASLPPEALDYLKRMVAAAKRMDTLILDLLAFSRVGRTEKALRPVDLDLLWRNAKAQLSEDLRPCVTLREPLGRVQANPSLLDQVAANLLSNAVKFVAPGTRPKVEVAARANGSKVRIIVTDNGIGIEPAHHARIFGIFERLHGVEQYSGTGIGLALVKKAAEVMNGSVGVESQPGRGSSFFVELDSVEPS